MIRNDGLKPISVTVNFEDGSTESYERAIVLADIDDGVKIESTAVKLWQILGMHEAFNKMIPQLISQAKKNKSNQEG